MPRCGSYLVNCDLPVRIDSYYGCSYDCVYCNEHIKGRSVGAVRKGEGFRALRSFIRGDRGVTTSWCDWNIPLHWGILSDPFQPCELERKRSLRFLREFAESGYPVVVSTKNPMMLMEGEYLSLLRHCNLVLQVSMTSPAYDKWEDCPSYRERFLSLYPLSKVVRRLLVRIQPYTLDVLDDVLEMLPAYTASGVHGVMLEGLKSNKGTAELSERFGSSMVYPLDLLEPDFFVIRAAADVAGLRFYAAENRLRDLGDSPTCCGTDDLDGFVPNVANLNHQPIQFTGRMLEAGTGRVFRGAKWTKEEDDIYKQLSYKDAMARFMHSLR